MSTKISRKKFTELIRTIIKKEIKEASTTATAGGEYDTPNAFQHKGKEKRKRIAKMGTEFKVVKEARYTNYRNDDTLTPRQKIGVSMREVRDKLTELSKLIDMNVKLKNELKIDSKSYWKNTHKAMSKISERLVKLANKVGKLQ